MMKKKHERPPTTHFDQISVEVVKKIAKADASANGSKDEKAGTDNVTERDSGKRYPNRAPAPSRDKIRP
jgi:hypothetical protein